MSRFKKWVGKWLFYVGGNTLSNRQAFFFVLKQTKRNTFFRSATFVIHVWSGKAGVTTLMYAFYTIHETDRLQAMRQGTLGCCLHAQLQSIFLERSRANWRNSCIGIMVNNHTNSISLHISWCLTVNTHYRWRYKRSPGGKLKTTSFPTVSAYFTYPGRTSPLLCKGTKKGTERWL